MDKRLLLLQLQLFTVRHFLTPPKPVLSRTRGRAQRTEPYLQVGHRSDAGILCGYCCRPATQRSKLLHVPQRLQHAASQSGRSLLVAGDLRRYGRIGLLRQRQHKRVCGLRRAHQVVPQLAPALRAGTACQRARVCWQGQSVVEEALLARSPNHAPQSSKSQTSASKQTHNAH